MSGHNITKVNGAKISALKKELVLTAEELEAAKAAGQDIKKIVEERHNALDFAAERQVLQNKIAALERGGPTQLRIELDNILKKNGINAAFEPLVELALERYPKDFSVANLAGQLVCSVDQRIKIWTELLSYQLPKLKAIEVAGQVDHSLTVVIRRFGGDALLERNITPQVATEVPVTVVPDEKLDNNKKKPNKRELNRKAAEETANAAVKIKKF